MAHASVGNGSRRPGHISVWLSLVAVGLLAAGCAVHVPAPGARRVPPDASLLITVHGGQTLEFALDEIDLEAKKPPTAAVGPTTRIALIARSSIAAQGLTTTTVKLSGVSRRAELFDVARELTRLNPEQHVWLVLYEPGTPRSLATRRLLSRTVAIAVPEGDNGETLPVRSPAFQRSKEASSIVHWVEAPDAVGALELAEALRASPDFGFASPTAQAPQRLRDKLARKVTAASRIPARQDEPEEAQDFFALKRAPVGSRVVPAERYLAARQAMRDMPQHSTTASGRLLPSANDLGTTTSAEIAAALGTWTPLGPGNIGGRTRAVLIDPLTSTTMYAGGVAGGVWKSTNGGASWTPLTDSMANLAVNSMAMDPSNSSVIYAGTGEGYFNIDAVRGAGIFKTTNAGATWAQLASTNTSNFYYVNKIVVSPNNSNRVYAATRTGLFRSLDAGATWTQVLNASGVSGCVDLVIRSDQGTDSMLAACGAGSVVQGTIYRNTDAGGSGSWAAVLGAAQGETAMARTSLAISPSNQNVVYALAASNTTSGNFQQGGLHAVFRSIDGGATWIARVRNTSSTKLNTVLLTNPVFAFYSDCGFIPVGPNQYFNQGWYDNVIAVDPADSNRVWVGGIDLFRSDDGAANWGMASHWWAPTSNLRYAHADQHAIVFHPGYSGTTNKTMFVGSDGGLFRTADARAATATGSTAPCNTNNGSVNWTALNNGYAVTQFYHGLPYPAGTTYFGGTQDNGTVRGTDGTGQNAWTSIHGGDGGYVAVDPGNTNVLYAEFTRLSIEKSTNGGSTWVNAVNGITESTNNFQFINPFAMDPSNAQRLWTGGFVMWRTTDGASSWTQASATLCGPDSGVTAIAIAPTNPNRVLSGMRGGCINRTTAGLTATSGTAWSSTQPTNGYVSWLAFDPTNENIAYATYSTFGVPHVWKSTDGGATWTSVDGSGSTGVPDIPVHSIVVDPANTARLYIGTDLGVLVSRDGGATWAVELTGFANVITEALALGNVGSTRHIFAFTHGRGAWRVSSADTATPPPVVTTNAASGIGQTSATLNGTVNPNGASTTTGFDYGTTTSYGSSVAAQTLTGSTSQAISASPALGCGQLYHFRAKGTNSGGTTNGGDQTFTTAACTVTPPVVTTNAASGIGQTSATLNGTVNPNGASTTTGFDYGTTTSYGSSVAAQTLTGLTSQAISASPALSCGQLYHFRAKGTNSGGTTNGGDQTFTTAACTVTPPAVTTNAASGIGQTSATLNGTVNPNGASTTTGFDYGTTTSYGSSVAAQTLTGSTSQAISASPALSCGQLYHFRAKGTNSGGTTNGGDQTFTTAACTVTPPVIFSDDMEGGPDGWFPQSPWALTTEAAHSGTHSWTDSPGGNYANNANASLFSPVLDLSGRSSVALTFWHRYDLEQGFDVGNVWATINGGATWVGPLAQFTGTSLAWTPVSIDLSAFAGQPTVQIAFQLVSDSSVTRDGWYIDDVVVASASFGDVPPSHAFWPWIEALFKAGITGGCSVNPPQYCPNAEVTRGPMAVFLLRGIHGASYQPPAATGMFADVPVTHPFATWIEQLAREGITTGCSTSPPRYCPDAGVTRGQMAVFLLRAEHGATYQPPAATGMFVDVPVTHQFATWIEQLAREGITGGCSTSPPQYCPDTTVTRGQMAVFLVRAFNLPM